MNGNVYAQHNKATLWNLCPKKLCCQQHHSQAQHTELFKSLGFKKASFERHHFWGIFFFAHLQLKQRVASRFHMKRKQLACSSLLPWGYTCVNNDKSLPILVAHSKKKIPKHLASEAHSPAWCRLVVAWYNRDEWNGSMVSLIGLRLREEQD